MESLLYAFFISESEAPVSTPRMLNGSKIWIWEINMSNVIKFQKEQIQQSKNLKRTKFFLAVKLYFLN